MIKVQHQTTPRRTTHTLFRVLLYLPPVRRWANNVADHLIGAPASEQKMWCFFKYAVRWYLRQIIKKYYSPPPTTRSDISKPLPASVRAIPPVRPTKKFLIALTEMPQSMEAAERCIASAKRYNEHHGLEIMPAVDRLHAEEFFIQNDLALIDWSSNHPRLAVMGCFSSHFKLWLRCMELGEPIVILEHDAMFCAPIPRLRFKHVIMLGRPHKAEEYKKYVEQADVPKGQETFHPWAYLLGTHCYAITPEGAHKLVAAAHQDMLCPVDVFICRRRVDLLYYHPHPVTLHARFSSIEKDFKPMPGYNAVY